MKNILLAIAVLLLTVAVGYCQTQPLTLTIKSDKEVYEAGEEINLEVTIKNITNKEVRIYSPDYWGASEITIADLQGIALKPRGAKIERRAFDAFMVIPPHGSRNHTFNNLEWFHCGGAWLFADEAQLSVGRYHTHVTLTNPPVDKCNSGKRFEETDLSGTLTSNAITIEVVEKGKIKQFKNLFQDKFNQIKAGMNKERVISQLGKPFKKRINTLPKRPFSGPQEDLVNILKPGAKYEEWEYQTDGTTYLIWFSSAEGESETEWGVRGKTLFPSGAIF